MSSRRSREHRLPETGDVYADDEMDPGVLFGDGERTRKTNFKTAQLCKQVERAVSLALNESGSDALTGAMVDSVEPAPDAGRLRIGVVLQAAASVEDLDAARTALARSVGAVRAEIARAIHRKRVPEIVFDLRLGRQVTHD